MSGWGKLTWASFRLHAVGTIVILLAAAAAIAPQRMLGYSCGHDFDFHLVSWFEAARSWQQGLFYPHWAMSPNYYAGEPRFVFYPPLTWMLGAALKFAMAWGWVALAVPYIFLAGTGLATRALARELLDDGAATLAGCVAVFSGYALFTAYERSAFGELTGGMWIPLLLLFALREREPDAVGMRRALDGSTAPLAIVIAGIWLSNVPLGVIACYLLAAVAAMTAVLRRSWTPVARAALGTGLGIGLACIYLVPATFEQKWVDVAQATNDPATRIESSWMFAHHTDPALDLHDTVLLLVSIIGSTMLAVVFASLAIAWRRGRLKGKREWWIVLGAIPVAILFLQFPVSGFVWNTLPKLRFLQFPWRWMVALEAPMAILFAAAVWPLRRRWQIVVAVLCAVFFGGAIMAARVVFYPACEPEDSISAMLGGLRSGAGFDGTDEYEPPNADDSLVAKGLPGACLVEDPTDEMAASTPDGNPDWDAAEHTCDGTFASRWAGPEHLQLTADAVHAGYLVLRLRTYPAWKVTVNRRAVPQFDRREDGLMAVPVEQGHADVDIRWTATPDVIAARWLSGTSLLLVTIVCLFERRRMRAHLS